MSHTPGPWRADPHSGEIHAPAGFGNVGAIYNGRDRALIVAAPDLLAVCEAAQSYFAGMKMGHVESARFRELSAAIKKARGK